MLARTIRLGTNHLQGIQDVLVFSARLLFGNSLQLQLLASSICLGGNYLHGFKETN